MAELHQSQKFTDGQMIAIEKKLETILDIAYYDGYSRRIQELSFLQFIKLKFKKEGARPLYEYTNNISN